MAFKRIVSSSTTIPTAFTAGNAGSEATLMGPGNYLTIQNQTATDIEYARGDAASAPSTPEGLVQAGGAITKAMNLSNGASVYIRGVGGTIVLLDVVLETHSD